jgi:NO-binding membrane sensor protein with MHYT domain
MVAGGWTDRHQYRHQRSGREQWPGWEVPAMLVLYDPLLVALSVGIAILGSYTGLQLTAEIAPATGAKRKAALAGAAITIGGGIWAMHFVGMLAVSLPIPIEYDVFRTLLSVLVAILMTGLGLTMASLAATPWQRLAGGGALMGAGIAAMHYLGMSAIRGACSIAYAPGLVALSVVIAILSSTLALRLAFSLAGWRQKLAAAAALGVAISGMHYTGMAAARFLPAEAVAGLAAPALSPALLACLVALAAFLICGFTLLTLLPDRPAAPAAASAEAALAPRLVKLPVVSNKATILLDLEKIVSIQAEEHYSRVFTAEASYFCSLSVSELEVRLDPETFLRVHRSHIVNLHRATSFERRNDQGVILIEGREVPVSRSKVPKLRAALGI